MLVNIIDYCNRPFRDVTEMDSALLEGWNDVVADGDDVWVLGDFALGTLADTTACGQHGRVSEFALLTPVPFEHLSDGVETCAHEGRVAFGSNAWELFQSDDFPLDAGDDVLIYASHTDEPAMPRVTWRAQFAGYRRIEDYRTTNLRRIRPPSTRAEDAQSPWAGFYEVTDLRRLANEDAIPIIGLLDQHGRPYQSGFFPQGPIVITAP